MTTGDLLTAGMLDADLAGDWFGIRRPGRIKRLRPDWTLRWLANPRRMSAYDVPMPVSAAVQQLVNAMMAAGRGDEDYSALATVLFDLAGLGRT
jgi:hypothetical protein